MKRGHALGVAGLGQVAVLGHLINICSFIHNKHKAWHVLYLGIVKWSVSTAYRTFTTGVVLMSNLAGNFWPDSVVWRSKRWTLKPMVVGSSPTGDILPLSDLRNPALAN